MHLKPVIRYRLANRPMPTLAFKKDTGQANNSPGMRQGWCERRDSNPHGFTPLEPKSSASTSSATLAMNHTPWQNERKIPHTGELPPLKASIQDNSPPRGSHRATMLFGAINNRGKETGENLGGEDGGPCRTRTYNQLIKSQLLYQIELTAQKRKRMETKTLLKSKS